MATKRSSRNRAWILLNMMHRLGNLDGTLISGYMVDVYTREWSKRWS